MAEQNIVQGLFGMTPESYQQQRDDAALARAAAFGRMDPMQAARTSIYYGANQLGGAIGGMLGAEDPQLVRIRQQQQVLSGLDINDPQSIAQAVKRASDMGNPQLALQLTALGDQALQRQDLSVERQDKLRQRQAAAASLARTQGARDLISSNLMMAPETISGQSAATVPEVDEFGYPLRSAVTGYKPAEFRLDYERVAPALLAYSEGRAELEALAKTQKAAADLQKANQEALKTGAEARIKGAEADVAPTVAQAEAAKKVAEAISAQANAKFAYDLAQLKVTQATWDVKNIKSQIGERSTKLGLDTVLTNARVTEIYANINKNLNDVPADVRKSINEAAVAAGTNKQAAIQFNDLANRIQTSGGSYGAVGTLDEFLKKAGGFQDGTTGLRQEYTRLINQAAIKSLPPGPATDKDIQMALSGFPPPNADPMFVSQFLRGMAKLQDIDAAVNKSKTDWLAQNNGVLGRAKNTFVTGDYAAKPGETFDELSGRIAEDMNKRYSLATPGGRSQSNVSMIPGQSGPTTGGTAPNVMQQADAIIRGGR
jgi:hypothetical protein